MKWIRANIKQGAQLALVALVVQTLLSFGHFHGVDARSFHPLLDPVPIAGSSSGVLSITTEPSVKPLPPSPHDPASPYDQCAICAVMAMSHASMVAAAPLLLLPRAMGLVYRTFGTAFIHASAGRVAFQPRAPPIS